MEHEKPFQSKKFLGYLASELTWKALIALALLLGIKNDQIDFHLCIIVLSMVLVDGFLGVGYLLGQASLDKYTRIAQIMAGSGKNLMMKGMQVTHASPPPEAPKAPEPPKENPQS